MAINVSISYFKAVRSGTLYAEGKEVSLNPKLATYLIRVEDQEGALIALFQGTVYRKRDRLRDVLSSGK
jgi:acyl-CoA thioesterase